MGTYDLAHPELKIMPDLRQSSRNLGHQSTNSHLSSSKTRGISVALYALEEGEVIMATRGQSSHQFYVLGVFNNKELVYQSVNELMDRGFASEDVSIYSSNPAIKTTANFLDLKKSTKGPESAITGAGIGATVGCALGGIFGTGLVPEFNGFAALGPMSTALWGFAMGGLFGGVAGGLIGSRVPEDDAKDYHKSLRQNETLLTVRVVDREQAKEVKSVLEVSGANKILFNQDQERYADSIVLRKRQPTRSTGETSTWNH